MNKTVPLTIIAAMLLGGCSQAIVAPIQKDVEHADATLRPLLNSMGPVAQEQGQRRARQPAVERVDGLYLPVRKAAPLAQKGTENAALNRKITVNRSFDSIQQVAEWITAMVGTPVYIAPEVLVPNSTVPGPSSSAPAAGVVPPPGSLPNLPTAVAAMPLSVTGIPLPVGAVALNYTGPVSGFLDVVAARYGVSWDSSIDRVQIFRTMTKTFRLAALPGDTTLSAKIANASGSASGGGGSGSGSSAVGTTASTSSHDSGVSFNNLSVWRGVEDSIRGMLSPSGRLTVTSATGTVTVTDTPQVVATVEKFMDQQNAALGRQVVINVRVLSVEFTDSDNYGINWDLVYSSLAQNFGWAFRTAFSPAEGAGGLAMKVLGTAGSATNSDPSIKAWSGSQALISALSKQGHVSQLTSASLTTLNNQVAPIQVGRQTSYLASSSATSTQTATTITLQPGLITTGFSMNLVPHLLDGDNILLQWAMDVSNLLKISTISSGGSTIQTPEIETRNVLQRVRLNSGDTLVVTGFEHNNMSSDMQGLVEAKNVALGGGVTGSRNRGALVILIQPVLADRS